MHRRWESFSSVSKSYIFYSFFHLAVPVICSRVMMLVSILASEFFGKSPSLAPRHTLFTSRERNGRPLGSVARIIFCWISNCPICEFTAPRFSSQPNETGTQMIYDRIRAKNKRSDRFDRLNFSHQLLRRSARCVLLFNYIVIVHNDAVACQKLASGRRRTDFSASFVSGQK